MINARGWGRTIVVPIATVLAMGAIAVVASPALARTCNNCEQEEPSGGGPGSGAGGGPAAAPVTVSGTFRYSDESTTPASLRPIARARVEIWRFAPHGSPVWTWHHDETTTTDENGSISVSMPFETSGIIYALRVTATNYAAVVWPNDVLHNVPFHQEPGEPDGAKIHRTANSPGETLDFSYDFKDAWTPQHFNLAETVRHGFDYVTARRDPSETDDLPRVGVQPTSVTGSWYNAPFDTVVITSGDVFSDLVVLHEYGHWVQEQIGSLPWNVTIHGPCRTRILDRHGQIVNSSGHAWMEGFASYFAQAVAASTPGATLSGSGAIPSRSRLETPGICQPVEGVAPADREVYVAASLWDLFDDPTDPEAQSEPADQVSRSDVRDGENVDELIIQMLDRELDMAVNVGGPFPTIWDFQSAWSARGLPLGALDRILNQNHIPTSASTAPDPVPAEPPSDAVCLDKDWTPGC
jgi:hypothetical protein